MSNARDSLNDKAEEARKMLTSARQQNSVDKDPNKKQILDEAQASLQQTQDKITAFREGEKTDDITRLISAVKVKLMTQYKYPTAVAPSKQAPTASATQEIKSTSTLSLCQVIEFCRFFSPIHHEALGTEGANLLKQATSSKPPAFKLNLRDDDE